MTFITALFIDAPHAAGHIIAMLPVGLWEGAPPTFDKLFAALFAWLRNIITVAGGFFLLIDMAKHIFSSPRDLRSAGIDLAVFIILLVVANQSTSIVTWAMGLS